MRRCCESSYGRRNWGCFSSMLLAGEEQSLLGGLQCSYGANIFKGGCFLLLIFGLISWAVGLVFYAVSMVVALGRSVQLYVYAAFSPIPISLLGFEETKQIGIGYLKNFAAAALAGVVMVLILYLYPHLVTALAVSGGLGKAEMLGLAQGVETFDSFGVIIKTIAVLITTMMGLVKSGSWAKEILGA